jgi:hypothetical protein
LCAQPGVRAGQHIGYHRRVTKPEADYLREFFAALDPKQPLDPGDKRRVPIYQRLGPDPIDELRASIEVP